MVDLHDAWAIDKQTMRRFDGAGEKRPAGASLKLLSLVEKKGLATVA